MKGGGSKGGGGKGGGGMPMRSAPGMGAMASVLGTAPGMGTTPPGWGGQANGTWKDIPSMGPPIAGFGPAAAPAWGAQPSGGWKDIPQVGPPIAGFGPGVPPPSAMTRPLNANPMAGRAGSAFR